MRQYILHWRAEVKGAQIRWMRIFGAQFPQQRDERARVCVCVATCVIWIMNSSRRRILCQNYPNPNFGLRSWRRSWQSWMCPPNSIWWLSRRNFHSPGQHNDDDGSFHRTALGSLALISDFWPKVFRSQAGGGRNSHVGPAILSNRQRS